MKSAFAGSGHNYGLSITIPSSYWYLQHFDIVQIARTIDWFNIMSYDLHGTWDSSDKYIGSIIGAHTNLTEIDLALQLLWRNNIDPAKVVLGLGFYGRSELISWFVPHFALDETTERVQFFLAPHERISLCKSFANKT